MGFWKDLFGSSSEKQGYVIGGEPDIERLFGIGGDAQATRYSTGKVYSPGGVYLGNHLPSVRDDTASMPEPPKSSLASFNTPLVRKMREFTERKLREN